MIVFEHAQPALLFLVPGCCFSILGLAAVRGELKKVAEYEENPNKKTEELKGNQ